MGDLRITALIDNKAPEDFASEHGLSLLAEYKGKTYLLDSGATPAFASNAKKLNVDLSLVDVSVLSHAHYDHSGGYEKFFSLNKTANVYLRGSSNDRCYTKVGPYRKYVGIPDGLREKHADRFIYITEDTKLDEGVWLIGHSTPNLAERGKRAHLYRKSSDGLIPDDFYHEQSLVFDTEDGLVILNSCCHGGADNIVAEVKSAFPDREISSIIGGFHLMGIRGVSTLGVAPKEVEALGLKLLEQGVKHTYVCHCTGDPASKILMNVMGSNVSYLSTATVIEF